MSRIFIAIILVSVLHGANAQVQQIPRSDSYIKMALEALGFYEGVVFSLDTLKSLAPQSRVECELAKIQFSKTYSEARANLYAYLEETIGRGNVEVIMNGALESYKELVMQGEFLPENLNDYLDEVRHYSMGIIPSPTKEILLYYKYVNKPSLEIIDGHYEIFSTKGHDKSNGLEIEFKIPITYSKSEGRRPHVVQVFREYEGNFGTIVVLLIKEISLKEGELDSTKNPSLLSKENILLYSLDEGAKLLSFETSKIDGVPFAITESSRLQVTTMGEMEVITLGYTTFYKNRLIQLQFASQMYSGSDLHYRTNKNLYKLIASSLIFMDKWK